MKKVCPQNRPFQPTRKPNKYRIEGTTAFLKLTQGQETTIDVEDLQQVLQHRWCAHWGGYRFYAQSRVSGRLIWLHRFLLGEPKRHVDHRDSNGLNNRKLNLRQATRFQNLQHRGPNRNNTTGFKGVFLHAGKYWTSKIMSNRRLYRLGFFATAEAAARAYDDAARKLHGEFARTNFPTNSTSA